MTLNMLLDGSYPHVPPGYHRCTTSGWIVPAPCARVCPTGQKHRSFREKTVRSRVKVALSLAVAAAGLFAIAAPAMAQQKTITVWWGKGFYKSEDDALLDTI